MRPIESKLWIAPVFAARCMSGVFSYRSVRLLRGANTGLTEIPKRVDRNYMCVLILHMK